MILLVQEGQRRYDDVGEAAYGWLLRQLELDNDHVTEIKRDCGRCGHKLWRWIQARRPAEELASQQERLQREWRAIQFLASDNNDQTEQKLRRAHNKYMAITLNAKLPLNEEIKATIAKFPREHNIAQYLVTLEALASTKNAKAAWDSYEDFSQQIVERLRHKFPDTDAGTAPASMPLSNAEQAGRRTQQQREHKPNECTRCDTSFCNGKPCMVFDADAKPPPGTSQRAKNWLSLQRRYVEHTKVKSMKGVRIPANWQKEQKALKEARGAGGAPAAAPLASSGASLAGDEFFPSFDAGEADAALDDDALWEEAFQASAVSNSDAGRAHSMMVLAAEAPSPSLGELALRDATPATTAALLRSAQEKHKLELARALKAQEEAHQQQLATLAQQQALELSLQPVPPAPPTQASTKSFSRTSLADISSRELFRTIDEMQSESSDAAGPSEPLSEASRREHDLQDEANRAALARAEALAARDEARAIARHTLDEVVNIMRTQTAGAGEQLAAALDVISKLATASEKHASLASGLRAKLGAIAAVVRSRKVGIGGLKAVTLAAAIAVPVLRPDLLASGLITTAYAAARAAKAAVLKVPRGAYLLLVALAQWLVRFREGLRVRQLSAGIRAAAMPLAMRGGGDSTDSGAVYDSACTHLMTRTTRGLQGELYKVPTTEFNVATGGTSYDTCGVFERTLYGANGESVCTRAVWFYAPGLPFDVVGKAAASRLWGAKYHDGDGPAKPPWVDMRHAGCALTLVRTPNELEWLGYTAPRVPRAYRGAVSGAAVVLATALNPFPASSQLQEIETPSVASERRRGCVCPRGCSMPAIAPSDRCAQCQIPCNNPDPTWVAVHVCSCHPGCRGDECGGFGGMKVWSKGDESRLALREVDLHADCFRATAMVLGSTGVGMGPLRLDDVKAGFLVHHRLRHPSLQRIRATTKIVSGLPRLTLEAAQAMAEVGCDTCNAYRMKLRDPKSKARDDAGDAAKGKLDVVYFDHFGPVTPVAAVTGYRYAGVFVVPAKSFVHVAGAKTLESDETRQMLDKTVTKLEAHFDCKLHALRVDGLSTLKGKELVDWFCQALVDPQRSPPGQHAYLGDVERYMYILFCGALIAMRCGRAPPNMWYECMVGGADCENVCASRLSSDAPRCGYEEMTGVKHDASDLFVFYAPGRFALDPGQLVGKWQERARAGHFLHRDIDCVLSGKSGSAVWWDGRSIRTVIGNYYLSEQMFYTLAAPNNPLLPAFPATEEGLDPVMPPSPHLVDTATLDTDAATAAAAGEPAPIVATVDAAPDVPIALSRASRSHMQPLRYGVEAQAAHPHAAPALLVMASDAEHIVCHAALDYPQHAPALFAVAAEAGSPQSVMMVGSGPYSVQDSVAALLRAGDVGVIQVDHDELYGGGAAADLTANTVFHDLMGLCKSNRIVGLIATQNCSDSSKARFMPNGPPPVRDQSAPDGLPDLPPAQRLELRRANLVSARIVALGTEVILRRGWFLAETPASAGRVGAISFDPAAAEHANLFETTPYRALQSKFELTLVTAAMCALDSGAPQQLREFLVSPCLTKLIVSLAGLQCSHAVGSHAARMSTDRLPDGTFGTKAYGKWGSKLCLLVRDGLLPDCPTGGVDLDMGAEQASLMLMASREVALDVLWVGAGHAPTLLVASSTSAIPITVPGAANWTVPSGEREVKNSPQISFWRSCERREVSTILGMGAVREVYLDGTDARRVWPSKFVYTLKKETALGGDTKHAGRVRLVQVGTGQRLGMEFDKLSTPTPDFATTLMLLGAATVRDDHGFWFDMKQYFQSIECTAPAGHILVRPPTAEYRFDSEGRRVVWECVNWLQGSRGAGAAARAEFVRVVGLVGITPIAEDPSAFVWLRDADSLRFTLHGDDGLGSATSLEIMADLERVLKERWPDAVFDHNWASCGVQGFTMLRDRDLRLTELRAPHHIDALAALLAGEVRLSPATPWSEAVMHLTPCELHEEGTPERAAMERRVSELRVLHGHMLHISKVRKEIITALSLCQRWTHLPSDETLRQTKLIAWYLISTRDMPLRIGGDPAARAEHLSMPAPLPADHVLDMSKPYPLYLSEISDGNLDPADRSQCGIIVMYARIAILAVSYRQHSIALDAHASECFSASGGTALVALCKERLESLGYPQPHPTPCYSDSDSTRKVAQDEAALKRSAYLRRRIAYMLQATFERIVAFYRVPGKVNMADPLTKHVLKPIFIAFRRFIIGS